MCGLIIKSNYENHESIHDMLKKQLFFESVHINLKEITSSLFMHKSKEREPIHALEGNYFSSLLKLHESVHA